MVARLRDPSIRAKVLAAMREQHPKFHQAGPDGMLLLSVKQAALKPLIGKTIAEIAKMRGISAEDAIIDLVIEDNAGAGAAYARPEGIQRDGTRAEGTLNQR
jgi:N-acyl-D-amino-acid deacylase